MALTAEPTQARPTATTDPTVPGQPKHARPTTGYATKEEADKARARIAELEALARQTQKWVLGIGSVGLVFTITNVTLFAMANGIPGGIAWILDLAVNLALARVLYVDGRLAILIPGYKSTGWSSFLRYFAFIATWLMNAWVSLFPDGHVRLIPSGAHPAGLLLHSAMPILVFALAEYASHNRKITTAEITEHQATIASYEEGVKVTAAAEAERVRAEAEEIKENERREKAEERARDEADRLRYQEEQNLLREQKRADEQAERDRKTALQALELKAQENATLAEIEQAKAATEAARIQAEADARIKEQQAAFALEQQAKNADAERERLRLEAEARVKAEQEAIARAEQENHRKAQEAARILAEEEKARQAEVDRQRQLDAARETLAAKAAEHVTAPAVTEHTDGNITTMRTREQQQQAQAEAVEDAARILVLKPEGDATASKDDKDHLMAKYGKGQRWVEQRFTDARRRLDNEPTFKDRVETEALEALAKVS
jgi:hypothetical protein